MPGLHFSSSIDKGFEKDLRRMDAKMNKFSSNVQRESQAMSSSLSKIGTAAAAFFSAQAIAGFTKRVIETRGEFEQLEIALDTIVGDSEKAFNILSDIKKLAVETPFSLRDIGKGAKQLLAFGISADEVIDTVKRLGDVAAGTGAEVRRINLAYGQVLTKGRLQSQELLQFAENGVPLLAELADMLNVSKSELLSLVQQGEIGFPLVEQAFKNMTDEGGIFNDLMAKLAKTVSGQWVNLQDTIDQALDEIGKANEDVLKGGIKGLSDLVKNWEKVGKVIATIVAAYGVYKAVTLTTAAVANSAAKAAVVAEEQVIMQMLTKQQLQKAGIAGTQLEVSAILEKVQAYKIELQQSLALTRSYLVKAEIAKKTARDELRVINAKIIAQRKEVASLRASGDILAATSLKQRIATLEKQRSVLATKSSTAAERVSNIEKRISSKETAINTVNQTINTAAKRKAAVASNFLRKATLGLSRSVKGLTASIASNPFGLILTAATLLTTAFITLGDEVEDLEEKTDHLADANAEAEKTYTDLKATLGGYRRVALSAKETEDDRLEAIKLISKEYPAYKAHLSDEGTLIEANKKGLEEYLGVKQREIRINALTSKLDVAKKEESKQLEALKKEYEDFQELKEEVSTGLSAFTSSSSQGDKVRGAIAPLQESVDKLEAIREGIKKIDAELLTLSLGKKEAETAAKSLKSLRKDVKDLEDEVSSADLNLDFKGARKAQADANKLKKEIEALEIRLGIKQPKKAEDKKERDERLKAIELEYQEETNRLLIKYGNDEKQQLEFQKKSLQNDKSFFEKRRDLLKDELEKAKTTEQIIQVGIDLDELDELSGLLDKYKTYVSKREQIQEEHQKDIRLLREAGKNEEAEVAEETLLRTLQTLDESIAKQNLAYQDWLNNKLPKIVKKGISNVQREIEQLQVQLISADPEEYLILTAQIAELEKELSGLVKTNEDGEKSFEEWIELMSNLKGLTDGLIESYQGANENTKALVAGIGESIEGLIGMAQAFKAVEAAASGLEKASAVILAISLALKAVTAANNVARNREEEALDNRRTELEIQQAINLSLIERNKLYKEGNELFGTDELGKALAGLDAYKSAISSLRNTLADFAVDSKYISALETAPERRAALLAGDEEDLLKASLDKVIIDFKENEDRTFGDKLTGSGRYVGILEKYDELIDANGELDTAILKTIIDTEEFFETDKEVLTNILELTEQAREAYEQFGDYISSIFGGVADEVVSAFQKMYEGGDDAMESLNESFSNMIESFTRDAIEFSLLEPLVSNLNAATKSLGEEYARGDISADDLQDDIVNELGSFYNSLNALQPEILKAYENADRLAERAGFDQAFNTGEDGGDDSSQSLSIAGQVQRAITEETGGQLVGRLGAVMLSNERIANFSEDMLETAMLNLVTLNKIKEYTSVLPDIAANTKKTADKLDNL